MRTIINNDVKRAAAFLVRLVRRNDKRQTELIAALQGVADGRVTDLAIFDPWLTRGNDPLVRTAATALRTFYTKSMLLQACNLCTGKKASVSLRAKASEALRQRRDLIETLIW